MNKPSTTPHTTLLGALLGLLAGAMANIATNSIVLADVVPRYTVETADGDAKVIDALTGLTWQQQQGSDFRTGISWEEALALCESLDYAGHDDWRLPNVSELLSLVDEKRKEPPAINMEYFAGLQTQSGFWTSTTSRMSSSAAYVVYFNEQNPQVGRGGVSTVSKTSKSTALCVRGGLD